jgi:hypothetical protein
MTRASLRALGLVSGWGRGAAALPDDARVAAGGRPVLSLGRPAREGERFRRATREGLLALAAVEAALVDAGAGREAIAGDRTAIIYATAAAYGRSNRRFLEGRGGSIHFAETAPAVVPAEVAIELRLSGPYAIFIGGPPATLRAIWHGAMLLGAGACDRALVVSVEIFEECEDLYAHAGRLAGRPLVEAAGCVWIERGAGQLLIETGRSGRADVGLRRRLGETFSCEPLAALDLWRHRGAAGTLHLTGRWRGETARLAWTDPVGRSDASAV